MNKTNKNPFVSLSLIPFNYSFCIIEPPTATTTTTTTTTNKNNNIARDTDEVPNKNPNNMARSEIRFPNRNPYRNIMKPPEISGNKEQLKEFLKRHDLDRDGKLSWEELKQAFKDLGSTTSAYRAARALGLGYADSNKAVPIDITNEELEALVEYARKHGYKIA